MSEKEEEKNGIPRPVVAELSAMKQLIKDCVDGDDDFHHLKEHVRFTLGIAGETMEMQQIHLFMFENEKDMANLKEQIEAVRGLNRKIIMALGVVASLLSALLGKIGLDMLGPGFEAFIKALFG